MFRPAAPHTATSFALLAFLVAGCGGDSGPTGPGGDDRTIESPGVSGTLGSNTEYVDQSTTQSALADSDHENHRYTFDAGALEDAGVSLESGEILLVHGVALRRISSVSESGGQVTVETSYATLPEAFESADIQWDRQIEFSTETASTMALQFEGRSLPPTAVNGNTVEWDYTVGSYTIHGELTANGSSAEVTLKAIKDLTSDGDATAAFTGTGTIRAPRTNANISIRDHETKSFDYENQGLQGDIKLSLAAAGAGGEGMKFKTPEASFRIPYPIGPIPVVITIKAGMVTGIQVHGNQASVTAESNFSYSGDAGLTYDGTTVKGKASSSLVNPSFSDGQADLAGPIGQTVTAQWGFVVPIIEVGLFGETVVPYVQPELYLRAFLTWGPVCQRIKVGYNVDAGVELRLLGVTLAGTDEIAIVEPKEIEHAQEGCESNVAGGSSGFLPYDPVEFDRFISHRVGTPSNAPPSADAARTG